MKAQARVRAIHIATDSEAPLEHLAARPSPGSWQRQSALRRMRKESENS
jgi:hypothetical protein